MPRTLPWLSGKTKRDADSPSPAPGATIKRTASPRIKDESGAGIETPKGKGKAKEIKREEGTPSSTLRRDFMRSSPSPPSSPIHRCPSEEFLIEGLNADDIHIMVEDEFYAVAQTFTRHLHYAEYVRRKREAKDRNADAIRDIARPTDGRTVVSEEMRSRMKAEKLDQRQEEWLDGVLGKRGEDSAGDEEVEEESSWAGTHLQELILSPRRARSLVGLKGMRSSTRAAAGFAPETARPGTGVGLGRNGGRVRFDDDDNLGNRVNESKTEPAILDETTDDDGDLDAGVRRSSPTAPRANNVPSRSTVRHSNSIRPIKQRGPDPTARRPPTTTQRDYASSSSEATRHSSSKRPPAETRVARDIKREQSTSRDTSSDTAQAKRKLIFDDFDELPELPKPTIQSEKRRSLYTHTKQQKLQDKNKEMASKKSRLNDVPTFLI
ncbi:uncharacterized protein BDV14DRAFT_197211 [Aspergillus stella-maris]|uniref:uncharacterized protein n=1 Tax=Aspergillus stella-maris TaxID=1810926 RepID=UPI003CCD5202